MVIVLTDRTSRVVCQTVCSVVTLRDYFSYCRLFEDQCLENNTETTANISETVRDEPLIGTCMSSIVPCVQSLVTLDDLFYVCSCRRLTSTIITACVTLLTIRERSTFCINLHLVSYSVLFHSKHFTRTFKV